MSVSNKRRSNMSKLYLFLGALVLSASCLHAQGLSVGAKLSTLGPGVEVEAPVGDYLGLRLGANYFTYNHNDTYDEIEYDTDVRLLSFSALLDWHPFAGSFRVSAAQSITGTSWMPIQRWRAVIRSVMPFIPPPMWAH
jgi:hypothetical protein